MTRWSLFLQTLSLLHHFLGLYCVVIEGRALELQILALVTAADRWLVSIPADALDAALNAGPTELRAALARLVEEHLPY